ncbi:MAG: hypothetical protein SFZ02_07970 [bacterium]|nr:hypothetical protein [bacterium]
MWRKFAYLLALIPIVGVLLLVYQYGLSPYPYADTTIANANTAILAKDNTLTIPDLFTPHYRHRVVFTHIVTAFLTEITAWDVRYEVLLNVIIGVVNCGLLAGLLWRFWGKSAPFMLIITTFLIMNLDQTLNWFSGLQTSWQFVLFFSLLTLHLSLKKSLWAFFGAVISGLCATLSLGNGIIIWAVLVIVLWLTGNRAWWRYLFILAMGGFFAYITLRGGLTIEGNSYKPFLLGDIPEIIRLWLLMLGRPIISPLTYTPIPDTPRLVYFASTETPLWLLLPVLLGIGILGYAFWTGYRQNGLKSIIVPIGLLIYACGSLGMIAFVTVLQTITGDTDKNVLALNERYLPLSLLFWLVVISMMVGQWVKSKYTEKIIISLVLVMLLGLHVTTLFKEIPIISFNELAFPLDDALKNGECAESYPLTGDRTCIYAIWMTDWDNLDQLASRRLAGYAQLPTQTLLPQFAEGDGIILNSESAWQSVHLRDFFFATIPTDAFFHIAPSTDEAVLVDIQQSPNPPHTLWLGDTATSHEALNTFLADKIGVWYVVRPPLYQGEALPTFRADIEALFAPARYQMTPENIQITRYIRPFQTSPQANFGDGITFMGWQWVNEPRFDACETITLQTAWMARVSQSQTTHLSIALVDNPITQGIITVDAPVSPIPIQFWEVDKPYYDERTLTIPCDLPSGNYLLTLTLYGITDGGEILPNLPISDTTIASEGHLLVVGEVVIP